MKLFFDTSNKAPVWLATIVGLAACLIAATFLATLLILWISLIFWQLPTLQDWLGYIFLYRFAWGFGAIYCARELFIYYRRPTGSLGA
jgi:hypothetical protein